MTERFPRKKALALHKVHVKTEENGGREKVFLPQHQLFDFNIILAKKFGPLKLQSVQFLTESQVRVCFSSTLICVKTFDVDSLKQQSMSEETTNLWRHFASMSPRGSSCKISAPTLRGFAQGCSCSVQFLCLCSRINVCESCV